VRASLIILIVMTLVVANVAVYRRMIIHGEDDTLHITDPSGQLIAGQREIARL